jgi:hypothetical protein
MVFRTVRKPPAQMLAARPPVPPMQGPMTRPDFGRSPFTRIFRSLQTALPPSSNFNHRVAEVAEHIQPVMLMPAPAANAPGFSSFSITGAAGVTPLVTSPVTAELWTPYIVFDAGHDDPVARRMIISLQDSVKGIFIAVSDSAADGTIGGTVPQGARYSIKRPIWVPPSFQLRVDVVALGAPNVISVSGCTAALNLAEPSPPLF